MVYARFFSILKGQNPKVAENLAGWTALGNATHFILLKMWELLLSVISSPVQNSLRLAHDSPNQDSKVRHKYEADLKVLITNHITSYHKRAFSF